MRSESWIENEITMMGTLLRSIPSAVTILFVVTVITMNFLSRITVLSLPWLAMNAGIFVSWLSFLLMDVVVKHYGAKAANKLSIIAITANLTCSLVCEIISRIGNYPALDMVVGGQWSILLASTIAYVVSALTNNYTNIFIGRRFRHDPDGKTAFAVRTFVSTFLSQILDNFIFVFLAFVVFPMIPNAFQVRWTVWQCLGASLTGAVMELLSEAIFTPFGYQISKRWKEKDIGREYLDRYCPNGVLEA